MFRAERLSLLVLLLLSFAGALSYMLYGGAVDDEVWILADAQRMAGGAVIYRDFWAYLTPLAYALPAALFKLFGTSVLAARALAAVALIGTAWGLRRAALGLGAGPWTAILPGLALVWALYRLWPCYSYHWLALPGVLVALVAAGEGLATRSARAWGLAGLACGLTALTIQSDGVIVMIATGAAAVFGALLGVRAEGRAYAAWALGLLLPLAACALMLAAGGALGDAVAGLGFSVGAYKTAGGLNDMAYASDLPDLLAPVTQLPFWYGRVFHFVTLYALLPLAALLALAWGLRLLAGRLAGRPAPSPTSLRALPWAFAAVGFALLAARGRADYIHAAFYAGPALVLWAAGASAWSRVASEHDEARWLRFAPQAVLVAFVATGAFMHAREMAKAPEAWLRLESPDARLAALPVVRYLREHTRPGDRLAVLPMGGLYYLFARPPAIRYTLLFPPAGHYQSEADYARAFEEIAHEAPRFVVIVPYLLGHEDLKAYLRPELARYRLATTLPSSEFGGVPAYLYERRE